MFAAPSYWMSVGVLFGAVAVALYTFAGWVTALVYLAIAGAVALSSTARRASVSITDDPGWVTFMCNPSGQVTVGWSATRQVPTGTLKIAIQMPGTKALLDEVHARCARSHVRTLLPLGGSGEWFAMSSAVSTYIRTHGCESRETCDYPCALRSDAPAHA